MTRVPSSRLCAAALCLLVLPALAGADGLSIKRNAGANAGSPFSSSIWVGDTLYVSGTLAQANKPAGAAPGAPPTIEGDTRAQTTSALTSIQKTLREQGLDMGDVIQMRVYLAGDPSLGGKMDFGGMNAAYSQFFGTKEQPNKPVRTTVQVAALVLSGALVEIEVTAVRGSSGK
jgi:enamine deaminase RidA (YjgF/YER057c/UK114 family)